jgi:hypothetical protein
MKYSNLLKRESSGFTEVGTKDLDFYVTVPQIEGQDFEFFRWFSIVT